MKSKIQIMIILFLVSLISKAQTYAPAAGLLGTSAMFKDSSAFINWAVACRVARGYQDISNPSLGFAAVGDTSMATGKAQINGILSLGDGGSAVCTFKKPIANGIGYDFAVFENSFNDTFLELAFVEVSSDGFNFIRFPSHSLSDTVNQYGNAAILDPTKINNLAGKYRGGYGTPFDLQELAGRPNLNINAVTHVMIVDVVGSLVKAYATYDSFGNKINDPWTTPFPSSGFDLDAIGVINESLSSGFTKSVKENTVYVYPNPVLQNDILKIKSFKDLISIELTDLNGNLIVSATTSVIDLAGINAGIYFLKINTSEDFVIKKVVIF